MMKIFCVGVNHKTAPVEVREKLSILESELPKHLRELQESFPESEWVILSTCNRTEVYGASEKEAARAAAFSFLDKKAELSIAPYFYNHTEQNAMEHLFRVAGSLDSMVVGEPQILGQVKVAYVNSMQCNASSVVLNTLFRQAVHTGKRARTETHIGLKPVSIGHAAVSLALRIFGELRSRSLLILGAGEMAKVCARHLKQHGIQTLFVANRTYARGEQLASQVGARCIPFEQFHDQLKTVDILLSSTGAQKPLLNKQDMQKIMRARKQKEVFLIDIAVPRDIESDVNDLENVFLYNIDDLQNVVSENQEERKREVDRVNLIVQQEVEHFMTWYKTLEITPILIALREKFEHTRADELHRLMSKLSHLPEKDKEIIRGITVQLVNKLLATPMNTLKELSVSDNKRMYLEALREIFQLDGSTVKKDKDHEP